MFARVLSLSIFIAFAAGAEPAGQPSSQGTLAEALDLSETGDNNQTQTTYRQASPWRAFGSLVFVLAIAGGGIWALRKWGVKRLPGSGGSRIKVEETLALGERRFVSILKVDDELFLISTSPQGVGLLARLDGGAEPGFGSELEERMLAQAPIHVRDMEARLRGGQQ